MKILLIFILLLPCVAVFGQSTLPLRADTVVIEKSGGNANLKIKNSTRDSVGGVLTNVGGGATSFIKSRRYTDSCIIIGRDTICGVGGNVRASDGVTIENKVIKLGDAAGSDSARLTVDRYLRSGNHSIYLQGNKTNNGAPNLIFDDTLSGTGVYKTWYRINSLDHVTPPYNFGTSNTSDGIGGINHTYSHGFNFSPGNTRINSNYVGLGESMEGSFQGLVEWHKMFIDKNNRQFRIESYTIDTGTRDIDYFHTVSRHYYKSPVNNQIYAQIQGGPGTTSQLALSSSVNSVKFLYDSSQNSASISAQSTLGNFYLQNFSGWQFPGLIYGLGVHNFQDTRLFNVADAILGRSSDPVWIGQGLAGNRLTTWNAAAGSFLVPIIANVDNNTSSSNLLVMNTGGSGVGGWNDNAIRLTVNGSNYIGGDYGQHELLSFGSLNKALLIGTMANTNDPPLKFMTDGVERLRITGAGRFKTYTPPPSGSSSDSLLTWRASDSTIYKIAPSVLGGSSPEGIYNGARTWNGDYTQNVNHKNLFFDSVRQFRMESIEDDAALLFKSKMALNFTRGAFSNWNIGGPFMTHSLRNKASSADSVINTYGFNAGGLNMLSTNVKTASTMSAEISSNSKDSGKINLVVTESPASSGILISKRNISLNAYDSLFIRTQSLPVAAGADTILSLAPASAPATGTATLRATKTRVATSFLAADSAAAVSAVNINLSAFAGYDRITIYIDKVDVSNSGVELRARFSSNGGSSFASGASDYEWMVNWRITNPAGAGVNADNADDHITLVQDISNVAGHSAAGEIELLHPGDGNYQPLYKGEFITNYITTGTIIRSDCGGRQAANAIVNAISFYPSAGTFDKFKYRVVGYKN